MEGSHSSHFSSSSCCADARWVKGEKERAKGGRGSDGADNFGEREAEPELVNVANVA